MANARSCSVKSCPWPKGSVQTSTGLWSRENLWKKWCRKDEGDIVCILLSNWKENVMWGMTWKDRQQVKPEGWRWLHCVYIITSVSLLVSLTGMINQMRWVARLAQSTLESWTLCATCHRIRNMNRHCALQCYLETGGSYITSTYGWTSPRLG